MKGQIFIVVSVFVAIALLAIAMSSAQIQESEDYLQDYFVNIRTELRNTIDISLLNGEDVFKNLDEYIVFSEKTLAKKAINQDISYTIGKQSVTIDIYLEKGEEYYRDQIIVPLGVYT